MFSVRSTGSTKNTERFLQNMSKFNPRDALQTSGKIGVDALRFSTPVDSGLASESWSYEVFKTRKGWTVAWNNSNVENGFPVALMRQYGHATGTGGYVPGKDYINPAMKPVFDKTTADLWKAVTSA